MMLTQVIPSPRQERDVTLTVTDAGGLSSISSITIEVFEVDTQSLETKVKGLAKPSLRYC